VSAVFVTGTDTGVGKTRVACAMLEHFRAAGLRAAGMKPVASGCRPGPGGPASEDTLALLAHGNVRAAGALHNPYAFGPAIAPHLAAEAAGVQVEASAVQSAFAALAVRADVVVVEGVGGWCVPLGPGLDQPALVAGLGLPVVLVVGLRLGCLNHALLTAAAIARRGVVLAGWVANRIDPDMEASAQNIATLRALISAPLLGELPWRAQADARADGARLQMGSVVRADQKAGLSR